MKNLAIALIKIYQRHVSPYKGFCCAYRQHTGCASCSTLGLRAIRRYGMRQGLSVLHKRMYLCGVAHRRFSPPHHRLPALQRGDCDLGSCDMTPDLDLPTCSGSRISKLCDFMSCCGAGSCDWPRKNHRNQW